MLSELKLRSPWMRFVPYRYPSFNAKSMYIWVLQCNGPEFRNLNFGDSDLGMWRVQWLNQRVENRSTWPFSSWTFIRSFIFLTHYITFGATGMPELIPATVVRGSCYRPTEVLRHTSGAPSLWTHFCTCAEFVSRLKSDIQHEWWIIIMYCWLIASHLRLFKNIKIGTKTLMTAHNYSVCNLEGFKY